MGAIDSWTVGAASDCDVVVAHPHVSGHHCRITRDSQQLVIEDLNSTNGTFVNGVAVRGRMRINFGDRVTLGQSVTMPWPQGANPAQRTPPVIKIGRAADNDIVLNNDVVSSYHARLMFEQGRYILEDLSSTNGTSIGSPERRITRAPLSAHETVYFGSLAVPATRLISGNADGEDGGTVQLKRLPTVDRRLSKPLIGGAIALAAVLVTIGAVLWPRGPNQAGGENPGVNETPAIDIVDDFAACATGEQITISVLENDRLPSNASNYTLSETEGESSRGGHWNFDNNSSAIAYRPPTGFIGKDEFTYRVTTAGAKEPDEGKVTVTVKAPTLDRVVYLIVLKDATKRHTMRLGTAWAASEHQLVTTAGNVNALALRPDEYPIIVAYSPVHEHSEMQIDRAAARVAPEFAAMAQDAAEKYEAVTNARKELEELDQLDTETGAPAPGTNEEPTPEKLNEMVKSLQDADWKYFQAEELAVAEEVGVIAVKERLPCHLPLANMNEVLPIGFDVQIAGIPYSRDQALDVPDAATVPVSVKAHVLEIAPKDSHSPARRYILQAERDISEEMWFGSPCVNQHGEVLGMFVRMTPPIDPTKEPDGLAFDCVPTRRVVKFLPELQRRD